jgi:hypothetical protein
VDVPGHPLVSTAVVTQLVTHRLGPQRRWARVLNFCTAVVTYALRPLDPRLAIHACVRDSRFMSVLSTVANWMQIVGVPFAIAALVFAAIQLNKADKQLDKAGKTARVQILLALDESLSRFEDLRVKLNKIPPDIKTGDLIELRRYIAAFERIGYALEAEEIDIELVDHFFGDRFKRVADYIRKNDAAKEIVHNREAWRYFYSLWKVLKPRRGLQEPP